VRELPACSATERRADAQARLIDLHDDLDALLAGTRRWANTPAGTAARNLNHARDRLAERRQAATAPDTSRRERRAAARSLPQLEDAVEAAEQRWGQIGVPEANHLQADITATDRELARLGREVTTERLDRLQARGTERAAGLDRGLGL
jgi:hypothetical protein